VGIPGDHEAAVESPDEVGPEAVLPALIAEVRRLLVGLIAIDAEHARH